MTWVKVCGMTRESDIDVAVVAGVDAVGFVNIEQSPRFVTLDRVAQLALDVPIHTVLLTLDLEPEDALRVLDETGVSGIQPYGINALETARASVLAGYLVLNPKKAVAGVVADDRAGIPLLDTPSESKLGGTGKTFDWALVKDLADRFVLAGGLGPDNVEEAISVASPWGVDASSGLEQVPGQKDHGMVTNFIQKAKST